MAGFKYLWANRAKFAFGSRNFFRAWAKRFFSFPELVARNHRRLLLIQKGAKIDETAEIGEVKIRGRCRLLTVGRESFLGQVEMNIFEQLEIGNRVCINDGVIILTASHDIADPQWKEVKKKIVISDYVWIGAGATILPGVVVGYGAVVGARAVVSKSVEPNSVVVGNPAKAIVSRRASDLNYNPCEFLAANRAWLSG